MKCISIYQPWAWAILQGYKTVEFRPRPTRHRGPLLIHASKTEKQIGYLDEIIAEAKIGPEEMRGHGYQDGKPLLHFGCLIGVVDVVDCRLIASEKQFGYVLANPRRIEQPVIHRGQQGFFPVDVGGLAAKWPDLAWLCDVADAAAAEASDHSGAGR